jgi:hypothetical protein
MRELAERWPPHAFASEGLFVAQCGAEVAGPSQSVLIAGHNKQRECVYIARLALSVQKCLIACVLAFRKDLHLECI